MRAIGATCGVGSMLIGARRAGFDIEGMIEWRPYYHHKDERDRNTFTENFPGAFMVKSITSNLDFQFKNWKWQNESRDPIDLVMGHPDCGNYSVLSNSLGNTDESQKEPGDIPIFVDIVRRLKPRFFVQDNLPRSLIGYPIQKWAAELSEYDLYPEWVSNWGYGNIQKCRKRFFMIGARKDEKFVFKPNEFDHDGTMRKVLFKEPAPEFNNELHSLTGRCSLGKGIKHDGYLNWEELRDYVLDGIKEGGSLDYIKADGSVGQHIGTQKGYKDKHAFVLTGGSSFPLSPWTGLPLSIRDRARIQGVPDDFRFYGMRVEADGTWLCTKNSKIVKQVAKFMPIQFCEYISTQIRTHIYKEEFKASGTRLLNPNKYIDEAKKWYCETHGYSNQSGACEQCWIKRCARKI